MSRCGLSGRQKRVGPSTGRHAGVPITNLTGSVAARATAALDTSATPAGAAAADPDRAATFRAAPRQAEELADAARPRTFTGKRPATALVDDSPRSVTEKRHLAHPVMRATMASVRRTGFAISEEVPTEKLLRIQSGVLDLRFSPPARAGGVTAVGPCPFIEVSGTLP